MLRFTIILVVVTTASLGQLMLRPVLRPPWYWGHNNHKNVTPAVRRVDEDTLYENWYDEYLQMKNQTRPNDDPVYFPGQKPGSYPTVAPPSGGHYPDKNPPSGGHYPAPAPPSGGHYPNPVPPPGGHYPNPVPPSGGQYPAPVPPSGGHYPNPVPPPGGNYPVPVPPSGGQYPAPVPPSGGHYPVPVPPPGGHYPAPVPPSGQYPTPHPNPVPYPPIQHPECPVNVVHDTFKGRGYFFSWEDPRSANLTINWPQAVNFCKARCLQLVSIESPLENEFLTRRILRSKITGVWTSGRKCDFRGCETLKHMQPVDIYGWFWDSTRKQLPPTTDRFDGFWGSTGPLGKPQPDNFEGNRGGPSESCLAILDAYDETTWHDEWCGTRHPFICQQPKPVPNLNGIDPYGFSYQKEIKPEVAQ